MKLFFSVTLILFCIFSAASLCLASQDVFPLGVWYEGGIGAFRANIIPDDTLQAKQLYKRDLADIATHGINFMVVPNTEPRHHKILLDAASANGIKLIVEIGQNGGELAAATNNPQVDQAAITSILKNKLDSIKSHPALWGVQIRDEPPLEQFAPYAQVASAIRRYSPKLVPFSCLIGSGNVKKFIAEVKPEVVAFDCYPVSWTLPTGDTDPLVAFKQEAMSAVKAAGSVPVWSVIQTHSLYGSLRQPTPAEVRCMSYLALGAGCKGLFWFLYQTEVIDSSRDAYMYGLVDMKRNSSDSWNEISKLTSEIKKIIPVLKKCRPAFEAPEVTCSQSAQVLKDDSGKLYVMVVNMSTIFNKEVSTGIALDSSTKASVVRVRDDKHINSSISGSKLQWNSNMAPGAGELYRLDIHTNANKK